MVESTHLVAIVLSVGAAFSLASQSLFLRLGTRDGNPADAALIVIFVNLLVLLPSVSILYYPDYGLSPASVASFIIAGISGTVIGRLLKYTSISKIGASRTEPITSSNALFATAFGVIFLDETLALSHGVGILLIVVGVAAIAWDTSHENPDDLSRRELMIGLLIPLGAAFAYALEPLFASIGFAEGTPAPVGLLVKTAAAWLTFALYLRLRGNLAGVTTISGANGRWFVFAGIANTIFLIGYYVSLSIAPVSVVVPIIITSTLFVIGLSLLVMPRRLERVTWRLAVAATIVVVGILIIMAFA